MFLMERVFIDKVAELLIQIESVYTNNGERLPHQVFILIEVLKDVIECQRNFKKEI
tara:strand:+ start:1937 stop:2104 length:168 start_codon:yes stop_codon:yes gene_type:complete